MKQVVIKQCQLILEGKICRARKGRVIEYEGEHNCLRPIAGETEDAEEIDFSKASKEELLASPWKFSDAQRAIKMLYDVELVKEENTTKAEVVEKIIDARFRSFDKSKVV